eukprot:TRINITY_DN3281_c0_g1_i1.p1 TRINITY_DN3281_c0_g1~~TRINITY_DN3281_c0_g1_i1.p1  ORF type:complete len:383 (+),score=47.94 TRINITY_DN3281_c0_g1_i1:57-1205(+)
MASHLIKLLFSLPLLITLYISTVVLGCDFQAIFNFGDSNSDTGGLSATFVPVPPPNGQTFFRSPAGRNCDGRLLIDFMANGLGLPFLNAYLDSVGSNFTHGANFATSSSTVLQQNLSLFTGGYSPFSLDVQSWQFSQFKSRSKVAYQRGGVYKELLPKEEYFSKALYTFDIGQNDITALYDQNMSTEEVIAHLSDVLDKFFIAIKSVYDEGGRSFWIHNTGPLGCLPYILVGLPNTTGEVDHVGCGLTFNEVAQYFNKKLKDTLVQLRRDLPLAAFTYVDVYSVKYHLISNAKKYGFQHPLKSCCGQGGKYNFNRYLRCGATEVINGTEILIVKSCKKPMQSISWDGVHFTEAANKWVLNQIVGGAFSDPPIPLKRACHKKA